jgi:hypothetical protein
VFCVSELLDPQVNWGWSTVAAHWGLWHHELWMQHHVWAHHSFTGDPLRDPDLNHFPRTCSVSLSLALSDLCGSVLFRKHTGTQWRPLHQLQRFTFVPVFLALPGQYIGQALMYAVARCSRSTLFSLPMHLAVSRRDAFPAMIEEASIAVHFVMPVVLHGLRHGLSITATHFALAGVLYYLAVAPNHDTDATSKTQLAAFGDWGEHQVLHSSNFSTGNRVLTALLGGMNLQVRAWLLRSSDHDRCVTRESAD